MNILAICTGTLVSIETVPDVVFSERIMGDGMAFIPQSNRIVAPVKGKIKHIYPTGHAVSIITKQGLEILVHFGLGSYNIPYGIIEPNVKVNQEIEAGAHLLTINLDYFKMRNINTITSVVFLGIDNIVHVKTSKDVLEGEILLELDD
nr:putative PTS system protein glucose subfamily IIA subunit [uncultured bacterium]